MVSVRDFANAPCPKCKRDTLFVCRVCQVCGYEQVLAKLWEERPKRNRQSRFSKDACGGEKDSSR